MEDTKFSVTIEGFGSMKRAKAFISWYQRQGEQGFWEELSCIDEDPHFDGCNVNMIAYGKGKPYFEEEGNKLTIKLE
jgi:hypothetical protein